MPMGPLDVVVFLGSVRQNREGIKAAKFVLEGLNARGHATTLVDPMVDVFPMIDKMYKEFPPGEAPEVMEKVAASIKKADAFVVVSAEYNHSIPPALSNVMDHYLEEYYWRPSGIVCYSPSPVGGVRAAMQLRAFLAEVGISSIPMLLSIGGIRDALDAEGHAKEDKLKSQLNRFLDELEWYAHALKEARGKGLPR